MVENKKVSLSFEDADLNKISKKARERKFVIPFEKNIYPEGLVEKNKLFIKSYRFLKILMENLKAQEEEISTKIETYLENFDKIYVESEEISEGLASESELKHASVYQNLKMFMKENNILIECMINDTFPIGKFSEVYDPSDNIGLK